MYNCINIDSPIITYIENEENKTRKTVKQYFIFLYLLLFLATIFMHRQRVRDKWWFVDTVSWKRVWERYVGGLKK